MTDWRAVGAALLRRLPSETAHRAALGALRLGLAPVVAAEDPPSLASELWGRRLPNPIGLAAGFDKNALAAAALLRRGFGFVEVGTVTPAPQAGNPRPRLFRLAEDEAVINRLGFNNRGLDVAAARLRRQRPFPGVVGANIGPNRASADQIADYRTAFARLAPLVDYIAVNVSSPNTPGLRDLQARDGLDRLLATLLDCRAAQPDAAARATPLLVKIAPDLDGRACDDIAAVARRRGIDGLIVSNTTTTRPAGLRSRFRDQAGGLSGRPLFAPSTRLLAEMHARLEGAIPLIGVGGLSSGAEAYAKIRAGASLVQLYTALVYHGLGLVARLKADLAARLAADGFATVAEAVGAGASDCRLAPLTDP